MPSKVLVYHTPSDRHAIFDHPSQITDWVNSILGRPNEASVEVIPKEFQVFDGIPHFEMEHQS